MDPITLAALLSVGDAVLQNGIVKEVANWAVSGLLPSYIANHLPLLKKTSVAKSMEDAYKKAVKRWEKEGGYCQKAYARKIETSESLKKLILGGAPDSTPIANTIAQYWWEEMEMMDECLPFVQKVRLEEVMLNVRENLNISKDTYSGVYKILHRLDEFKTTGRTEFQPNPNYIRRYCEESHADFFRLAQLQVEPKTLVDFLIGNDDCGVPHIVLFANPQMGKTTELLHIGHVLQESSMFMPVLFQLRVITSIDILPQVEVVDGKSIVLLIDAFDETRDIEMAGKAEILKAYASKHPLMRIVVACRRNYEYINSTLDFQSFHLAKLNHQQIVEIVDGNERIPNKQKFLEAITKHGLNDIIGSPFFLNVIMDIYAQTGELPNRVTDIYKTLIDESYRVETETNVNDETFNKETEYRLLQEVALVLLMTGQKEISVNDLRKCFGSDHSQYASNLHFGILDRNEERGCFSFNHNELCEYLAASSLSKQSLEKVQILTCVKGCYRIRSQWDNVIRLYAEITADDNGGVIPEPILKWLQGENEKVLVQLSSSLLTEDMRSGFIKDYLERLKAEDKFIDRLSNQSQFCHMARFGATEKVLEYFIGELNSSSIVGSHQYNIIMIISYLDWDWLKLYCPGLETPLIGALESLKDRGLFDDSNKWLNDVWRNGIKDETVEKGISEPEEPVEESRPLDIAPENKAIEYRKRRVDKKNRDVSQLLQEAVFVDMIKKELSAKNPMPWEELYDRYWDNADDFNTYILNYLNDYTFKEKGKRFIDNKAALEALCDHGKYLEFCHSTIVPLLLKEDDELVIDDKQKKAVIEWAKARLYDLLQIPNTNTLTPVQKLSIELLLHGDFTVDQRLYFRLLDYSRWPFSAKIENLYDDYYAPVFDYLQGIMSPSDFNQLVTDKMNAEGGSCAPLNFCLWARHLFYQKITETDKIIIDRIRQDHEVRRELIPIFATSERYRPLLMKIADENVFYQDDAILLAKTLQDANLEMNWTKEYIERNWDWMLETSGTDAVLILLKLGGRFGLEQLMRAPDLLEHAGIVIFNYQDDWALPLLLQAFEIFVQKKQIPDPCLSIISNINAIAMKSDELRKAAKDGMNEIKVRHPELKNFVDNWSMNIDDSYCNLEVRNSGIDETLSWIRL